MPRPSASPTANTGEGLWRNSSPAWRFKEAWRDREEKWSMCRCGGPKQQEASMFVHMLLYMLAYAVRSRRARSGGNRARAPLLLSPSDASSVTRTHACVTRNCATLGLPVHRKCSESRRENGGGGWRERERRRALATSPAPSGVCCHFSGGVPPTRCKRRRQQSRAGDCAHCVCVCACDVSAMASFGVPDHVCFLRGLQL